MPSKLPLAVDFWVGSEMEISQKDMKWIFYPHEIGECPI